MRRTNKQDTSTNATHFSFSSQLASLQQLERSELLHRWKQWYAVDPPPRISQQLLVQGIAYKMQEKVYGGLKPATRKFLEKMAKEGNNRDTALSVAPPLCIKPSTRLLREWHGTTYEVEMVEDGVLWQGKQYRSLSKVAHLITGTKRSGHLFFGLKSTQSSESKRKALPI